MKRLSTQTYVGLSVVLVILVSLAYAANWAYQNRPAATTTLDLSNPNVFIDQLNTSIERQLSSVPQALADELRNSRIYFMLANKGSSFVRPYVFEGGRFTTPANTEADGGYYSYSPNGQWFTFIVERDPTGTLQEIYRYSKEALNGTAFSESLDSTFVVPDHGNVLYKRLPATSDTGDILFAGWKHESIPFAQASVHRASEWSIYRTPVNGDTVQLADGFNPRWVSDTKFIFLKDEGLFSYNVTTGKEKLLIPTDIITMANNRLDISDDDTLLAWIQPDANTVSLYTISEDGNEIVLSGHRTIPIRGFWVTISPSGAYIAAQTIRSDAKGSEISPEPKILFFDTKTLNQVPGISIGLEAFSQEHMFMTDWSSIK